MNLIRENKNLNARPLLKWAGGKTQLLDKLLPLVPKSYGKYIEPFFGGGAMFFSVKPLNGIIADSNPEIINFYQVVRDSVFELIGELQNYENSEEFYYSLRKVDWTKLSAVKAAARTLFLNKTCFNGLYRVNRKGQFNVPFGHYKNPKIIDADALQVASDMFKTTQIICGDYKKVLRKCAEPGDFIFLDPPYLPISKYSDFKRYTKEQFYEEDHRELAEEIQRLHELGCYTVLTNSNHPLVHELYGHNQIEIVPSKRHISSKADSRRGEDAIIIIPPKNRFNIRLVPEPQPEQVNKYPTTRFMGSKSKLLQEIWAVAKQFEFNSVLDLFSGSGIVGYMFKAHGKQVISNDYMAMSSCFSKAMIENNHVTVDKLALQQILTDKVPTENFVTNLFKDLYFNDIDNLFIDKIRANLTLIKNPYAVAIIKSALIRACLKKRPRGIFTYVGNRYNDGRKDLQKTLEQHFIEAVEAVNNAVFDNAKENKSTNSDAMLLRIKKPDLVYMDPPYYSPYSDNEYVRRYHFVEGIARDWKGVEIQQNTVTKKFKSYPTPFSTKNGASDAFDQLFKKYSDSILIVSYSSNSLPDKDEMLSLLAKHKRNVEVVPINYRYSFGNQGHKVDSNKNEVQEYLFVGF